MDYQINTEHCAVLANLPARITSPYGHRIHPITHKESFHSGVDLVPVTDMPVIPVTAISDGIVIDLDTSINGYDLTHPKGNYVRIQHIDTVYSTYLHLSQVFVHRNDHVVAG